MRMHFGPLLQEAGLGIMNEEQHNTSKQDDAEKKTPKNRSLIETPVGAIPRRLLYVHETYNHASDPERHSAWLPCHVEGSVSSCVVLKEEMLACNMMDQENAMVCPHGAADINAVTRDSCAKLAFLRESMQHHLYSRATYQQLLELLGILGIALPVEEIISILLDVLRSDDCHFIMVTRHFLIMHKQNQRSIGPNATTILWDIIHQSLKMLHDVISKGCVNTSAFQASRTVLEYFMNCELDQGVLSAIKWSWYDEIFNATFALLELNCSAQSAFSECVDILLSLALMPLRICDSKFEQEELSTSLAKQLSKRIALLPSYFKKCFALIKIPSEHVRLKVVDIHLDSYFPAATDATIIGITESTFVSKFRRHLQRNVIGKQDLSYFLSLLTMLLQSHLLVVSGVPMISQCTPAGHTTPQLHSQLTALNQSVTAFINKLSTHPDTASYVITPTNWYYLELLITLTS